MSIFVLSKKHIFKYSYYLLVIIRILQAPFILYFPFVMIILSIFLDAIDVEFAHRVVSKATYQFVDKWLDNWCFAFEFIIGYFLFPEYRILLSFLFLWRTFGTILFSISKKREYFLIFGNYFENILICLFLHQIFPYLDLNLMFVIGTLIKIFQE